MKRDALSTFNPSIFSASLQVETTAPRTLCASSPFAGMFKPDGWKGYVEFDICHSFPVIAGPTSETGNYIGFHPATLARSCGGLVHQQTNLHHLIKAYNPKKISRDRIVGAVVATYYPPAPSSGWSIPDSKDKAIPIKVCAVIFKQAEGALELLKQADQEDRAGRRQWSVSIECLMKSFEDFGIYIPSERKIVPILEADDDLLSAVSRNKSGQFIIGQYKGEQLAFAYGGNGGEVIFQGVGYTPTPAEREAEITSVRLSRSDLSGDVMALRASRIDDVASQFVRDTAEEKMLKRFPGAKLEEVVTSGVASLRCSLLRIPASEDDPVLRMRLKDGRPLLMRWSQFQKKSA